jgi:hypothetical protein
LAADWPAAVIVMVVLVPEVVVVVVVMVVVKCVSVCVCVWVGGGGGGGGGHPPVQTQMLDLLFQVLQTISCATPAGVWGARSCIQCCANCFLRLNTGSFLHLATKLPP